MCFYPILPAAAAHPVDVGMPSGGVSAAGSASVGIPVSPSPSPA